MIGRAASRLTVRKFHSWRFDLAHRVAIALTYPPGRARRALDPASAKLAEALRFIPAYREM
ncbi:hypothetical protein KCP69_24880 [Salmonella enterica subsp. enterica]|nr:hypothetical protein KCP69_24880 [Salmonella enterica subsp. enterica]